MASYHVRMPAKMRSRLLVAMLTLALAWVPSSLNAAGLAQATTGDCQVLVDQTSRTGWTAAIQTTFVDCVQEVAQIGDYADGDWAYGFWAGNDIGVNQNGEVYYKDANDSEWQFWDSLAVDQDADRDADQDGVLDAADQCLDEAEVVNNFADQDGCPDSLEELLQLAMTDIDAFWQQTFDEQQWAYIPPSRLKPYTGRTAKRVRSGCGSAIPNNAMYCAIDHGIYYDMDFLYTLLLTYGDYAPVLVMAHEWGHSIQPQVYGPDGRMTIKKELEADCLAGAYTRYAALESKLLEEGDVEEGIANTYAFGDDLPWFDPQAHGSPEQRVAAFSMGVSNGVDACWLP